MLTIRDETKRSYVQNIRTVDRSSLTRREDGVRSFPNPIGIRLIGLCKLLIIHRDELEIVEFLSELGHGGRYLQARINGANRIRLVQEYESDTVRAHYAGYISHLDLNVLWQEFQRDVATLKRIRQATIIDQCLINS